MKPLALLPVVLAASAAAAAAPLPSVVIELRPQFHAGASPVLLGQVARLESADLQLMQRLVDLPVGRAPSAGNTAVLERDALAGWLRRRLGLAGQQVEWKGPERTRVLTSSRTVSGDEVAAAASQVLQRWLSTRALRSEVDLVAAPRDVEASDGDLQLRAREPGRAPLRRRMTVWVDVLVAGRFVRAVPVSFAVSAWGDGAVAAGPIPEGTALHPDLLHRGEVDLLAGAALQAASAGMRPRRALIAGEALRPGNLEPVPAVARGEWASLRSGSGRVRTEARVQVLQDGRVGDNVRVRPATAAASLLARVTGSGQLEVGR